MNGAHLKPLDRGDMKPKVGVRWNSMINNVRSHVSIESTTLEQSQCDNKVVTIKSPEVYEDFLKVWKTMANCSEKFNYVWNLR